MRRSKEIMILFVLLVGAMGFVLWYVIDRRAKMRPTPPIAAKPVTPAPPVDLAKHEHKTIDFSSGQPVVKDSAEDKAAIDAALKDMDEAKQNVPFAAPKKPPGPTTTLPKP